MSTPTQSRKQLTLDTDWMSALLAAFGIVFLTAVAAVSAWRIVSGIAPKMTIDWRTWVGLAYGACLTVSVKNRALRFCFGLMVFSFGSRILLVLVQASQGLQGANARLVEIVDLVAFVGLLIYGATWLGARIRHV